MSDTPRTDECTYPADCLGKTLVVNADLAKSLERELKEKWEALFDLAKDMGKLQIELEQANRRLASEYASSGWDDYSSIKLLQRENAALREQNENLASLLFRVLRKLDKNDPLRIHCLDYLKKIGRTLNPFRAARKKEAQP